MTSVINLTPTSYIVLGLLEQAGRATPYELKALVAGSVGNLWSIPHSQLYAEPDRLARADYLNEARERSGRRRRSYTLTARGAAGLEQWRSQPTDILPELRDLALLKIFFGAEPSVVAQPQLAAHEAKLAEYRQIRKSVPAEQLSNGPVRALDAGIAHEREWVRYWRRLAEDPST